MSKFCPTCNKFIDNEVFKYCPECATLLIDKVDDFMGINLGDANAISGGINISTDKSSHQVVDSHNIAHSVNSNNVHNTHTFDSHNVIHNNITNIAQPKTEQEQFLLNKQQYLKLCEQVLSDGIVNPHERMNLESARIKLGLDGQTANSIFESVRQTNFTRNNQLNTVAKVTLEQVKHFIKESNIKMLQVAMTKLRVFASKFQNEELQYTYYLVYSLLNPDDAIRSYEQRIVDDYWQLYWVYVSYLKKNRIVEAENILVELGNYDNFSDGNITILATLGALLGDDIISASVFFEAIEKEYSDLLCDLYDSIEIIVKQKEEFFASNHLTSVNFYLDLLFPKLKSDLLAEIEKKEEARREAERLARERAERERQQREEEERRRREAEERRRKEEAARREAERLARERAEKERQQREEEERRRREADERKRREEAVRREAERLARERAEKERQQREYAERERLRQEEWRKQQEERKRRAELYKYCPKCGTEIRRDAKFCKFCGNRNLENNVAKENVCPNCNTILNEGAKFCKNCGKQII